MRELSDELFTGTFKRVYFERKVYNYHMRGYRTEKETYDLKINRGSAPAGGANHAGPLRAATRTAVCCPGAPRCGATCRPHRRGW